MKKEPDKKYMKRRPVWAGFCGVLLAALLAGTGCSQAQTIPTGQNQAGETTAAAGTAASKTASETVATGKTAFEKATTGETASTGETAADTSATGKTASETAATGETASAGKTAPETAAAGETASTGETAADTSATGRTASETAATGETASELAAVTAGERDLKPGEEKDYKGVIAIDPGHQQYGNPDQEPVGPGASSTKAKVSSGTSGVASGVPEYQLTLEIGLKLRDELEERGYKVVMSREINEIDISNSERADIANDIDADAFVRIHANGSGDGGRSGAMTICQTPGNVYNGDLYEKSRALADCILDAYVISTGIKYESVWETDSMSGINWSQVPVTIIEMGYMTNSEEDLKMQDSEMQEKMVDGIADGIDAYMVQYPQDDEAEGNKAEGTEAGENEAEGNKAEGTEAEGTETAENEEIDNKAGENETAENEEIENKAGENEAAENEEIEKEVGESETAENETGDNEEGDNKKGENKKGEDKKGEKEAGENKDEE